jgi:hypothetical protein
MLFLKAITRRSGRLLFADGGSPDPENRAFVHADPLAWTEANRGKILRALYTLLIAGAVNRPSNQEAKTRFKVWWRLVGWPMEYAAALLGTRVDCTKLMRAGEAGDEEAAAVTAALSILRKTWDGKKFTAKEVAKAIAPIKNGAPLVPSDSEDTAIATAEALADALDELAGKRLDRPTARRIGKLFQKCLVDRPARRRAPNNSTSRANGSGPRVRPVVRGGQRTFSRLS